MLKNRNKLICLMVLVILLAGCLPPGGTLPQTGGTTAAPATAPATEANTITPQATTPPPTTEGPSLLAGTQWRLESFGQQGAETPVAGESELALEFNAGGQAGGNGGCNTFGAPYSEQGNSLSFGAITSTKRACAEESLNQQEQAYFAALQAAERYELNGDRLTIFYNNGQGVLNFVRASSTVTPEATATEPAGETVYLDDRSTPTGLLQSYFNAINRKEFARAYSYWRDTGPNSPAGPFEQFAAGFADTASVEAALGTVSGDAGAGQMYYSVPVALRAETTSGEQQVFAGCYVLHLSNPQIQAEPPFQPLGIERADVQPAAANATDTDLLAGACPDASIPLTPQPETDRDDISAGNYLDDRSGPVEVLKSLFNAVNRKEYARAYSYWEAGAPDGPPPFDDFAAGYADTESVALQTGDVTSEAGAGQVYYSVPVVLTAQTTGGEQQVFAGCYVLHLSNPQIQAEPPFRPLAIRSASVQPAASGDTPDAGLCASVPSS